MKHSNIRIIVCLILLFPLFSATPPEDTFFKGSFHSAQQQANYNNKGFFAVFGSSDCSPCEWLDNKTFQNTGVDWYIRQNYVGIKINVKAFDGAALKQRYQIARIPTVIVFDESGNEKGRIDQAQVAADFLYFMKHPTESKYQIAENLEAFNPVKEYINESEITEIAPLIAPPSDNEVIEEMDTPSVASNTSATSTPITGASSKRFTIQIGAFSSRQKAFGEMERLDTKFGKMLMYYPESTNGKQFYKISVGAFSDRKDAENLKNEIRNLGFSDAWVKAF